MRTTDEDIEIGINHQLAIHSQCVQQPFYIFFGDAIGRIGHGAVALRLALQLAHKPALSRYLYDLIVDDAVSIRYLRQEREEVGGNVGAVDVDRKERPHEVRHIDFIYIHQRKRLYRPVAYLQVLVRTLEVGHGEWTLLEPECHKAVKILVYLRLTQLAVGNTFLLQNVSYLGYLDVEVLPSFGVVFHEGIVRTLLRNDEEGAYVGIFPALEVVEVTFGQELLFSLRLIVILLLAEDVLFL